MRPSRLFGKKIARNKKNSSTYRARATAEYKQAFERLFGSQGAASPVRIIDPRTGKVVSLIEPDKTKTT